MEEIREAALAYYNAGTEEQKELARSFFKALDVDGDGTVSEHELLNFLRDRGCRMLDNNNIFQPLDRDGNGCLDFNEVITLYYIIKSGRPYCDGCGIFIKGLFFTCLNCYESSNDTFDLCCKCYRGNRFVHRHAAFLDNYTLLSHKRLTTPNVMLTTPNVRLTTPNVSQKASVVSVSSSRKKSINVRAREAFEALDAAVNLVNTCTTM